MRKLPVYFVIDVSDSMVGEPLNAVQNGLESILTQLRNDPYALETVYIGIIISAGKARVLAPLEELSEFRLPRLPIGPGTNLGQALELLMDCIERDVQKTTAEKKGDWKPVIFLFTDGAPTSSPAKACKRWNKHFRKQAFLVAVTFGNGGDVALLESLTDTVLNLADTTPEAFREFFQWVSASLQVSSMALAEGGPDGPRLAEHGIRLEKARPAPQVDENFAILPVRCSNREGLWLAKYGAAKGKNPPWRFLGAYPVDSQEYGSLAGQDPLAGSIGLNDTDYFPECPICGSLGVVRCSRCHMLSCLPKAVSGKCSWCGQEHIGFRQVDNLQAERSKG